MTQAQGLSSGVSRTESPSYVRANRSQQRCSPGLWGLIGQGRTRYSDSSPSLVHTPQQRPRPPLSPNVHPAPKERSHAAASGSRVLDIS